MSVDKHRGATRRLALLRRAVSLGFLWVNMEGGISAQNPDLRRCVRDGLLEIRRDPGVPKWSRTFRKRLLHGSLIGTPMIRRTRAYLTPAGLNKIKTRCSSR
jgi:hypothetical protein